MNKICVFCGSGLGKKELFKSEAKKLGRLLAEQNKTLVYGGGNIGLMGTVADACLDHNGSVIGVIPDFLMKKEVGHTGLTELIIVDSMHERKQKMADLADAFIAMPGGFGTLEELAEILTWVQLELVVKPVCLLNTAGYYDALLQQLNTMVEMGFLHESNRNQLLSASTAEETLHTLAQANYRSAKPKLGRV